VGRRSLLWQTSWKCWSTGLRGGRCERLPSVSAWTATRWRSTLGRQARQRSGLVLGRQAQAGRRLWRRYVQNWARRARTAPPGTSWPHVMTRLSSGSTSIDRAPFGSGCMTTRGCSSLALHRSARSRPSVDPHAPSPAPSVEALASSEPAPDYEIPIPRKLVDGST
jgi:hypothetical protein